MKQEHSSEQKRFLVLDADGSILYVTESVSLALGLTQVRGRITVA